MKSKTCIHDKTDNLYVIINDNIINSTNNSDGEVMVLYKRLDDSGDWYVREKSEFINKFTLTNNIRFLENWRYWGDLN